MKYSINIPRTWFFYFIISACMLQGQGFKYGIFKSAPSLDAVYVEDNEESYQLVMEFSGANFDYVTNETFAPPSISLLFKNVTWDKGNFSKKCDQSPLYQYSISVARNVNQNEIDDRIKLKLDFTRVPEYSLKLEPSTGGKKKHVLKIVWEKNNVKKSPKRYAFKFQETSSIQS